MCCTQSYHNQQGHLHDLRDRVKQNVKTLENSQKVSQSQKVSNSQKLSNSLENSQTHKTCKYLQNITQIRCSKQ